MSTTTMARRASDRCGVDAGASSDHAARMEAVFDRCSRSLYRYVLVRVGGDAHLADDVLQQLWCQACDRARHVPPAEMEFWLRAVAKNLIRTHWRRMGRRPPHARLPDASAASSLASRLVERELPLEELSGREVREHLLLAITALDSADQELIVEHYFHGLSHTELGARRGLSERAVEGRLYRARQRLREQLARHMDED